MTRWPVQTRSGVHVFPIRSYHSRASHVAKHLLSPREAWWQVEGADFTQSVLRQSARWRKDAYDLTMGADVSHTEQLSDEVLSLLCLIHDDHYAPAYGLALSEPDAGIAVPDRLEPGEKGLLVESGQGVVVICRQRGRKMHVSTAFRDPPARKSRRERDDFDKAAVRKARWLSSLLSSSPEDEEE